MHLSPVDWTILIGYLVIILAIGIIASSKIKTSAHYFLGNRRFGKLVMVAQNFGTGTHAEMPVSLAGVVYGQGLSGIWYQWKNLFVTPFYWILAPLFRRFRRTTMSEVMEDRYGAWMGALYTIFALAFFSINLGSMLKGAAKVIDEAVGGNLSVNAIVVGMTVIFVFYSFIGGLIASAWIDVLQGFLILILSFMVIPTGWSLAGGLNGMRQTLGADKLSLIAPDGIGFWFVLVLTVNGLIGIVAQPHMIGAVGTGKDESSCRVGQFYGSFIKRVCTLGWAIVGLITATLVAKGAWGVTKLADSEEAFGFACRHLLFPGGIGLLVACFLAANMGGCSAFMVDSGAMVTNGLYRRYFAPGRPDPHYLWVGRISGMAVTLVGVAYAVFFIKKVLYSFLLTETMATFVGISILGGLIWPRANRWGALGSVVVSMGINFAGYAHARQRLDYWDPGIFSVALGAGVIALVALSLLTPPEPKAAIDHFYVNLQSPSGHAEAVLRPIEVARAGQRLLLVNLLAPKRDLHGIGFLQAYRTDLVGLIKGAALVVLLLGGTWLLIRLGN